MSIGVRNPIPGVVYPPNNRLQKYVTEGVLDDRTLAGALTEALQRYSDNIALSDLDGEITYRELDEDSDRFAGALISMGIKPLDRVIFQLRNSKELIIAIVACWKADLIPVCTLAAHRDQEISYLAHHAEARAHIIGIEEKFDYVAFAQSVRAKTPSLEHIIVARGERAGDLPTMQGMIAGQQLDAARSVIARIHRDPYQVTIFQLSGGTTSIPKIIPRFSNEYLYNMEAMAEWESYSARDVVFMPLQIIHNAAMVCFVFPSLLRGGEVVVAPDNEPATIFGLLQSRRPTIFGTIGSALGRMRAIGAQNMLDLSRVRAVFSTNAARQTEETLGVTGVHLFGMTEGLIIFGKPTDPEEARFTTVGRPISAWDEVRIVKPGTEEDVPMGEIGEMVSRGPYTFYGYYDAAERNAEVFTSDGFYRSGDLMSARKIDGEVYYAFEGRLKDLISRGGEKINCEEVEHASRRHPSVSDIAIVAMPDPQYEERACAFVIATPGEAPITVESLREFLVEEGLAKFKCPERVELVDAFPLTDSGKLSKPKLKATIENMLDSESAVRSEMA